MASAAENSVPRSLSKIRNSTARAAFSIWPVDWRKTAHRTTAGAVVQYAKTQPVFDGYKAARYSRKYLPQHEAELADNRRLRLDFWTLCPEVQRVWGAPQQAFLRGPRPCKNFKCVHTRIACRFVQPRKSAYFRSIYQECPLLFSG